MPCGSSEPVLAPIDDRTCEYLAALARVSSRSALGPIELLDVRPPLTGWRCRHRPTPDARDAPLTLLAPARGVTFVRQHLASVALREGDLCLIDESRDLELVAESRSRLLLLRLPSALVTGYYPGIRGLCGMPLRAREPGVALLADLLLRSADEVGALSADQRLALLGSIVALLGTLERVTASASASRDARVSRALAHIELNLSSCDLTTDGIARSQGITRRHLDRLMMRTVGRTINDQLSARRLERACADLRNPACGSLSVAQIAAGSGFADAGHFARSFKRAFLVPPTIWRERNRLG